jgi:hypothetical protein
MKRMDLISNSNLNEARQLSAIAPNDQEYLASRIRNLHSNDGVPSTAIARGMTAADLSQLTEWIACGTKGPACPLRLAA